MLCVSHETLCSLGQEVRLLCGPQRKLQFWICTQHCSAVRSGSLSLEACATVQGMLKGLAVQWKTHPRSGDVHKLKSLYRPLVAVWGMAG